MVVRNGTLCAFRYSGRAGRPGVDFRSRILHGYHTDQGPADGRHYHESTPGSILRIHARLYLLTLVQGGAQRRRGSYQTITGRGAAAERILQSIQIKEIG